MTDTKWDLAEFTALERAYTNLAGESDAVITKANESPNILCYGLFCSGIIGWWMQVAQSQAQEITHEVKEVLEATGTGVAASREAYASAEKSHQEKVTEVEKAIDDTQTTITEI